MDEQHTRVETDRMSGDGQAGNGSSRERRAGDPVGDYRSASLDDGRSTPPAATGVGFDPPTSTQPPPEQRTREIRAEIAQTREDLSETVNAIQDRLSPRNIASNAADSVRQAASDTARDIAESDSVQYVRSNPVPTAMVGIGIAGLAWLCLGGRDAGDYSRSYPRARRRPGLSAYDTHYPDEGASTGAASARMNRPPAYSSGDPYGRRGAAESDVVSRGSVRAAPGEGDRSWTQTRETLSGPLDDLGTELSEVDTMSWAPLRSSASLAALLVSELFTWTATRMLPPLSLPS